MPVHALKPPSAARRTWTATPARPALPAGVRAKLKLGGAQDEAEKQADRMAARALARPLALAPAANDTRAAVRRALAPVAAEEPPPAAVEDEQALPDPLEQDIRALQVGGTPLPPPLRAEMEARFGLPLHRVRIHTGADAARLSEILHAHAFTVGEHIAFNAGRFQPETSAGRFLLAHELAHVVQQRAGGEATAPPVRRSIWSDLYDRAAGTLGDIADWGADQVRTYGWRLLESISPEFAAQVRAIADEGILAWLGRKVSHAWDGYIATLQSLVPFDAPQQLLALFAGLAERAATIAAALASGQCEPLLQALGELKHFVIEVLGVAWDRLTDFVRPIGDFFSGLWRDFAAPALQWLQDFGGTAWAGILALGHRFWRWIQPVRDAAGRIWDWFSDLLFGPSEGSTDADNEAGVLAWIKRKAGDAWDWVKEKTRPVWQPVADFAETVTALIPPAFVREMGDHAQQLAGELDATADGVADGGGVADARDTLATVLPSVQTILATVRRIMAGAGAWLLERVVGFAGLCSGLLQRLRASPWLSWLAGALGWLEQPVARLVAWAADGVTALFDRLLQGFDALAPFLQLLLETVRKLITVASDLLQLPLLILSGLWQRVPACIREPVEDFIQNQVLARIPAFGQFFADPELWPRVRQTALGILRRIFVDGDLPAAAWAFFRAVLDILEVPAELVVRILAKAAGAMGAILTDPLGFLANLVRAVGAGFHGFFGNIATHLRGGFSAWLLSTVREAGIQPPADFSPRSVLGFVLEVLGITTDHLFARLSQRIGPAIVARLRQMTDLASGAWSFVATLATEGAVGLWRQLSERLSNLWDSVVAGVTTFITERVIGWASRWLLSLLDVSGIMPVINALVAVYRAIQSFMAYLRQMLEIVGRVLDGIVGIAGGAIERAAGLLEGALAEALPIAIGFLANQAGLGRLSERLREILGALRGRVHAAMDWLIERALRFGRAVLELARRGATAVRRGASRLRVWWQARRGFRAHGEDHSVYIRGHGRTAQVMVASNNPRRYPDFLKPLLRTPPTGKQAQVQTALDIAGELDIAMAAAANDSAAHTTADDAAAQTDHAAIIDDILQRLATATAAIMPMDMKSSGAPIYGPRVGDFGSSVSVFRLTPLHAKGSVPSSGDMNSTTFGKLNKRRVGNGSYYVKGHLLNHNLGGPGNTWDNLTPLTRAANSDHERNFENTVKAAVNEHTGEYPGPPDEATAQEKGLKTINFVVTARYGRPSRQSEIDSLRTQGGPDDQARADIVEAEQAIPVALDCHAREVLPDGQPGSFIVPPHTVRNEPDPDVDRYALGDGGGGKKIIYLSKAEKPELMQLDGMDEELADAITAIPRDEREETFRTWAKIREKVPIDEALRTRIQGTPGFVVRIYKR